MPAVTSPWPRLTRPVVSPMMLNTFVHSAQTAQPAFDFLEKFAGAFQGITFGHGDGHFQFALVVAGNELETHDAEQERRNGQTTDASIAR